MVIPGRNTAGTIAPCLDAATALLGSGPLDEIVFVDDASTDSTVSIVQRYPVRLISGEGKGAGHARNLGWRAAAGELIWFVDSDCVAEPGALDRLLSHMKNEKVAAVGGSLSNRNPESVLASIVHEEIVERHRSMPERVNFLATANVLYRRRVLEQVGGFDERFRKGQDAELSWRVLEAGYELAFEIRSQVGHHYHLNWRKYLYTQAQQGYWRVWMHLRHRGHAAGDSYSRLLDHVQPPLAMLVLASIPLAIWRSLRWLPLLLVAMLLMCQLPMTWRLTARTGDWRMLAFAPMSLLRSIWRGVGMSLGTVSATVRRRIE